jgi:hypothetical protein
VGPEATCAVCGRTILSGEGVRGHVYTEGERRPVCELCPSPDPAAAGARPAHSRSEPTQASPFELAVERFNVSEAGHTVAGLMRTLGTPWVSVGASAGSPNEVRITVAWELSWYQWGVDLGDESRPVFELDKGGEIDQIDSSGRQWNASATENGRVILTTSANGHAGEPLSR